jgi:hypothetical protein
MPTLILDGDARGAVKATSDVAKGLTNIASEARKAGVGLADQGKKVIASLTEQRKAMQRTFGSEGSRLISDMISQYGGLTGAIALVGKALRDIEQDAQRSADATLQAISAAGMLQQLPDFPESAALARQLIRSGVVPKENQALAYETIYDLKSAALTPQEIADVVAVGEQKFVKPEQQPAYGGALKKFQSTFGEGEAGSIKQVISKIAQAAEVAQADAVEVAIASTKFGSEADALGMSDEKSLAAFLAIEKRAPNPDEAATRLRAFLSQVDKNQLWKGSLEGTLAHIKSREEAGETTYGILKEQRAVTGYRNLQMDRKLMRKSEQALLAANARDLLAQGAPIMQDPVFAAGIERQKAEGDLAFLQEQRESRRENLFDAMRNRRQGQLLRSDGRMGLLGQFEMMQWYLSDFLGKEDLVMRQQLNAEAAGRGAFPPSLISEIQDYLKRQTTAVESVDSKTKSAPLRGGRQE